MATDVRTADDVEVIYPSSDGQPMAETPIHVRAIILLFQALEDNLFPRRPDDYVAADMLWYWEEGKPSACRAPDVMVIKGVGQAPRRSFFSWRENGAVPAVIVEFASEKTWRDDLYEKTRLYAALDVREYFIFDPEGSYLRPQLWGFRLREPGRYGPLEPGLDDRLDSEELGLSLRGEGTMLRLIDAAGRPIPTREERTEQERQLVAQERQRAEQAERRAEQERQRADALAAEVARLRAQLERGSP